MFGPVKSLTHFFMELNAIDWGSNLNLENSLKKEQILRRVLSNGSFLFVKKWNCPHI